MNINFICLTNEIVLFVGIVIVFFYGMCFKKSPTYNHDLFIWTMWTLIMCLSTCIYMNVGCTVYFLDNNFFLMPLHRIVKIFILIIAIIIVLISQTEYVSLKNFFEFYLFILLSLLGLFLMMSANNLLLILIFLEIQGVIAYTLTGFRSYSNISKESMVKFFILGAIITGFMGYGISIIYNVHGTTLITELATLLEEPQNYYLFLGLFFLWSGFLFKLAVVPFHFWIADIYQGAPLIVTLFFATISKIGFVFLVFQLIKLLNVNFLIWLILLSMFYGTIMSLYQVKIIRLIAFSSIVNVSFALIVFLTEAPVEIGMSYIIIYSFLNVSLFLILIMFKDKINNVPFVELVDFSKIMKINPIISLILIMTLLSIGGIPPLAGFFIKWYVFNWLICSNNYFLAFFFIVVGVINAVYYIRLVRLIYLNSEKQLSIENFKNINILFLLILVLIFLINIFFIFIHIKFLFLLII
jgi:NADH-quinone oxidoreductase subunit N